MTTDADLAQTLRDHLDLCGQLRRLVEAEAHALTGPGPEQAGAADATRKQLLPRLSESVDRLRVCRLAWQRLEPGERVRHPEVAALLRQSQDAILKVLVLDRENEQSLLRRGLLPARGLPSANRQRPHFVAALYRRGGGSV
jgi:hypothetical protein